jgi:hypothetical protein
VGRAIAGFGFLLLLGLLAPATVVGGPGDRVEVYAPRHRTVEDLAPLVSGVLAPSGEAIPDPSSGRLILRGDAASVERALEVLASLDTPIRSYRVESILSTLRDLDRMGVELGGWLESGGVRIGRASGPEGVAVRLDALRSSEDRHFRGLVTVIDGRAAELWTGTEEPRRSRHIEREGGRVRIHETTTLVPVRTGFRVVPRGLPDGRVDGRPRPIDSPESRGKRSRPRPCCSCG